MKWHADGPCAIKREDGAYRIFRAPQHGHVPEGGTITFVLVDSFAHEAIGGLRNVPDLPHRVAAAVEKLKGRVDG